ncbi:GAF and ANTAR domain-containing protein [Mycolicibacterium sp. CBM1]
MTDYDAQPGRTPPEPAELSASQRDADKLDLSAGLRGVAGIVAGAKSVSELLRDVAEFATHALPGVDSAGVALIDDDSIVRTWAATSCLVDDIDAVQYREFNEGPCLTCMESRRPAVSGSLGSDSRWPHFGGRVARMGVHSALSLPLIIGDHVIGAINAYAYRRDAFGEHAVRLGAQFAGSAAVSVYNAQLLAKAHEQTERLQHALTSRAVIDQAIGIIRSRSGGTAEEAFHRLTELSQQQNIKLHVVAEQLVEEAARRARVRRGQS